MIDYFYQLNYDDSPQVKETTISTKVTINGAKSPESPVERKVEYLKSLGQIEKSAAGASVEDTRVEEDMPAEEEAMPADEEPQAEEAPAEDVPVEESMPVPAFTTEDDFSRRFKTSKNDKKKRKHLFSWEGFPPPEPASKSKLSTVSKSEVVRHFHFDTPDNDLDNTELGINALMYALADKYG